MDKTLFRAKCVELVNRLSSYCQAKGLPAVHHYMKSEKEMHIVARNGFFDAVYVVWLDKDGEANWGILG